MPDARCQMHASAQPGPRVRRIDFINQLTGRKSTDRAPVGGIPTSAYG
jgi:hypothetical protein